MSEVCIWIETKGNEFLECIAMFEFSPEWILLFYQGIVSLLIKIVSPNKMNLSPVIFLVI